MNTQELFDKIRRFIRNVLKLEHAGKSKAAHGRARKALGEIKKVDYRISSSISC